MTPETVAKIRADLDLTQEDLSLILGVTKTTVTRYEMQQKGSSPQGFEERKLDLLMAFISDPDQYEQIEKLKKERKELRIPALAAILAIGAATNQGKASAVEGTTLDTILTGGAFAFMLSLAAFSKILNEFHSVDDMKKHISQTLDEEALNILPMLQILFSNPPEILPDDGVDGSNTQNLTAEYLANNLNSDRAAIKKLLKAISKAISNFDDEGRRVTTSPYARKRKLRSPQRKLGSQQ